MILKVGSMYTLRDFSYDGDLQVIVSAVGIQNVMLIGVPFIYYNGRLNEFTLTKDKFEEIAKEQLPAA